MVEKSKSIKDYWIEMAIREIWTQCHFAEISYNNIHSKAENNTDLVFSSIHSFLTHSANVSKLLQSKDHNFKIALVIEISDNSPIHNRVFRDHLENYDARLKKWIGKYARGTNIGTYNIGPKDFFKQKGLMLVSHYDPTTDEFIFIDQEIKLSMLFDDIVRIREAADNWVKSIENHVIEPPFDSFTK